MRLRNVLQQITEAISFGRKEINQVIRSDDIRIGFEFEVAFEEGSDDPESIWELSLEALRQIDQPLVNEIETDLKTQMIEDFRDQYDYEERVEALNKFDRNVSELLIDRIEKGITWFNQNYTSLFTEEELTEEFYSSRRELEVLFDDLMDLRDLDALTDPDVINDLYNLATSGSLEEGVEDVIKVFLETFYQRIEDVTGAISNIYELDDSLNFTEDSLQQFDDVSIIDQLKKLHEIINDESPTLDVVIGYIGEFKDTVTDFKNRYKSSDLNVVEYFIEAGIEIDEERLREAVIEYIDQNNLSGAYNNLGNDDAVAKAEELVRQYGLEDVVREVVHDSSIENDNGEQIGAEIVTNPLPPSDIQDVMETMFSLINDNDGQTNRSTGLHMNISSTDFSFNLNNFDLLKFFLFIDEGFIESSFERESSDYVMSLKDKVSGNEVNVLKALDRYLDYGIEGLEDFTREAITIREKYAGINILNMDLDSTNMGQNRIEVRYPGNDYASKSPSEVTWHAYRILYMLMIAFNEDFERETYLRLLYEFWDDITKDTFGKSFGEALREFRETEDVTSERTTERSAMDQVERIRQFQRLGTDDENNISVKAVLKNLENRYRAGDLKSSELLAVKDILRQYNRL